MQNRPSLELCIKSRYASHHSCPLHPPTFSSQRLPRESGQHKARLMNLLIIVPTQFILFLRAPAPQWHLYIPIFILATDHKPDLPAGICRDSGVGVFDGREDFFAGFFEVSD